MTIYLTQGGEDETKVDEIEDRAQVGDSRPQASFACRGHRRRSVNGADRSVVLLVAATPKHANVDDLIDVVRRHPRNLFFIVVGGDISARDYKRLIQSGNADWVAEAGPPQEILDIVGRVSAPAMHDVPVESPVVVSFTPSAGGVGNSTLAIETAVQLVKGKSNKSAKVALVDLDFQSSHVCDYLDIAPKFQFEEIVAAPDRLDDHLLSAFISHHSSGLDVLAASRSRFHARDLSVEALSALFDRMAQRYATIIIDLPLSVHSWTLPAARGVEGDSGHRPQHHSRLAANRGDASSLADRGDDHRRNASGGQPMRIWTVWAAWRGPIMWRAFSARKSACSSETPASRWSA